MNPLNYFSWFLAVSFIVFWLFWKKDIDELLPPRARYRVYAIYIPLAIPATIVVIVEGVIKGIAENKKKNSK